MSEQKEREYRIPVAYVLGNVISVFKTETQMREDLRKQPIPGIDPDASQEAFFAAYNKHIKENVLKEYYLDMEKERLLEMERQQAEQAMRDETEGR